MTIGTAAATPLADPSWASCTTENCSSVTIGGTVLGFANTNPGPWVPQLASPWVAEISGLVFDCVRLDVLSQNADLKMVVTSPGGDVYANDDRGTGDTRPLVKINGGANGWYTVSVSKADGGVIDSDFTLAFGRYNLNNPNCASPTPSTPVLKGQAAKARVADTGPRATGGPGDR